MSAIRYQRHTGTPVLRGGVLRTHYLSDGLCTLITRSFDDLEVGRVGLGRTEKLVKLSDLVDFCKGEIFPYAVFPAKEPCMQTAILKWHTSSSELQNSLACLTALLVPRIEGKKYAKGHANYSRPGSNG
jgi:hypothetical protein